MQAKSLPEDYQYGSIELAVVENAAVLEQTAQKANNEESHRNDSFGHYLSKRPLITGVLIAVSFCILLFGFGRLFAPEPHPVGPLLGSPGTADMPGANCQGTVYGSSLQWCPSGTWGTGACYFPASQNCENGLVCLKSNAICPPGSLGTSATCYVPNTFSHDCGYIDLDCRQGQLQCNSANCTCCPSGSRCWGP